MAEEKKGVAILSPSERLFVEGWEFMQTLGEGAYGEVKLAVHKESKECVAVKIMHLDGDNALTLDCLKKEICIMKMLRHDNVVRFFGERACGKIHYLFLEYVDGGELFDRIEPDHGMEPGLAQHFFLQLLQGLEYLHSRGVAHRDIKPENILLDGYDVLKISDFGLSTVFRHLGRERKLTRCCGTPPYIAPEVYSGAEYYAEPADLWSCGIVLVALLSGELPWDSPSYECPEYREWCSQNCFFTPWSKISNEPLALLKKLLRPGPSKRYTIAKIRDHVWCKKVYEIMSPSNEALAMVSPTHRASKRIKVVSSPRYSERPESTVTASQPVSGDASSAADVNETLESSHSVVESFTQPSRFDELIIGTQIPCTPGASQTSFQRLALRMTRFYTKLDSAKVWNRLRQAMKTLGYDSKPGQDESSLTVSAVDKRKQSLVFKAVIYELRSDLLLVEFRRSKGDGIEFKKIFKKIKDLLSDIMCKPPSIQ
ncbi:PREDICTED: serine/threonine-protein kinase Chk1-like [Amphimedon queenslandica]|uniref:non-specific serine/threonine protein kinase n=1 Tax=Amphimedon queenslandica TaxID=400682 RepID=A0A1X7UJ86_AMPQE|nr:PREDICTED: serine/threonine-protein kinase Chk1-like [Amphimedon queenslandica]|eukprot:XP_019853937.1 PREDICTED: serine/threonine-protein kinase Chk1-like [Amphimedon queenslandica]